MVALFERGKQSRQRYADILAIAVAPAWQHQGIGGLLLKMVISMLEEQRDALSITEVRLVFFSQADAAIAKAIGPPPARA